MTISLSQAFAQWCELNGDRWADDAPALSESWNDYTDMLCKDGELTALQYHYAPAYDDTMPREGSRWDALRGDREFILDRMGVTLSAVFVPFSQSRDKAAQDPSLNWRVTLEKDGREVITTDYMQGCAHTPAYSDPSVFPGPQRKRDQYTTAKRIREECETGRHSTGRRLPLDPPDVADVLHSLLRDSEAMDCGDFADWCGELGYDTDSIKARAVYDACIAEALKLRAAFGEKTLADLHELFADF
jgi:hypothetical protein